MSNVDRLRSLASIALDESSADQTEVRITSGKWSLTRFANSNIHQNMSSDSDTITVRAVIGKKSATSSAQNLTGESIRNLTRSVVEMARATDPNPDFVSLPEPQVYKFEPQYYSDFTADSTPEDRASAVSTIVNEADRVKGTAAGSFTVSAKDYLVMNSLGVDSFQRATSAGLVTVVTGPDGGFGYAGRNAMDVRAINIAQMAEEAARRAYESQNPTDIGPGEYETILMPYATVDMLKMLAWMGFEALAYQEGRSFMVGKIGEKIADESVSIWDDGQDPRTNVDAFDCEGIGKQRVDLIKNGIASGILYDSYTARREGKKSTGHACGSNIIMQPGDASIEEMIKSTKRGILVTRFHYTNIAHLMTASFTGMTRDGTFLIENGKIARPVKNLRFTQSILEALANVDAIGRDALLEGGVYAPALKVKKFRFSSATAF